MSRQPVSDLAALHEVRGYLDRQLAQSGIGLLLVTHHLDACYSGNRARGPAAKGQVFADGPRHEVLQPRPLSELFGVGVNVYEKDGYYQRGEAVHSCATPVFAIAPSGSCDTSNPAGSGFSISFLMASAITRP